MILKNFRIDKKMYEKVLKIAKKQDRSFSYIIREALKKYINE